MDSWRFNLDNLFFIFYEIERIVIYNLSTEKFIENIKVNEMKKNIYKVKQKLRGGNKVGEGQHINWENDDDLENKLLSAYSLIVNDWGGFEIKIKFFCIGSRKKEKRKNK